MIGEYNLLESMLKLQHDLQTRVYGYDFTKMTDQERVAYVKDMTLAAQAELYEALSEVHWKPWATESGINNQEAYIGELVDTLQFVMNLLLATGIEPTELTNVIFTTHARKVVVNSNRHKNGYDGVSTKCPRCKRALDDPAVNCNTVKVDEPPKSICDGWCEHEGKFYYWINTVDADGMVCKPVTIVPEDQPIGHRDTVAS